MGKKAAILLCAAILCIAFLGNLANIPNSTAYADSYSSGTVTIDTPFITGSLSAAITTQHSTLSDIAGVMITAGELNETDFYWMRDNLLNLQALEIIGNATLVGGEVPYNAFFNVAPYTGHENLSSVTIASATSIGEHAFYRCGRLTSVSFPDVISIGDYTFYGCGILTSVSFPLATSIGHGAFYQCNRLLSVSFPLATSIGSGAFRQCSRLLSVSFPEVMSIKGSTFVDCTGLISVSFPSATSIGLSAFAHCTGLTSVSFPLVTSIDGAAFYVCTGLISVSFPEATSIGANAFVECVVLEDFTLGSVRPSVGNNIFLLNSETRTVYVPSGSVSDYRAAGDGNTSDNKWYGCDIVGIQGSDYTLSEWIIEYNGTEQAINADNLNLAYETSKVLITATANDASATISGNIDTEYALAQGQNNFVINVTAENPIYKKTYNITINRAQNDGKDINAFVFESFSPDIYGQVDNASHTVSVTVPYGTNCSSLAPTIGVSENASISHASGATQDFSSPITYQVTAQDGSTQDYIVTVSEGDSTQNEIQSFTINALTPVVNGQITAPQITLDVPEGTDVTALIPTVIISPHATVSPQSLVAQDFTNPVTYTVTAQNGSTREYIVTAEVDASTNTHLDYLKIDGVSIMGFSSSKSSYSINVPYGKEDVAISAMADDKNAMLMGAVGEFSLRVGDNEFELSVTAEDGATKQTYMISIYRAQNNDATLQSLTVDGKTIVGFDPLTTLYEMKVEKDVDSLKLGYRPTGTDIVTYFDYPVSPGENTCTITVKNNAFEQEYTIVIIQDEEAALSSENENTEPNQSDEIITEKIPDDASEIPNEEQVPQENEDKAKDAKNGLNALEIILIIAAGFILATSVIWFSIWKAKRR